MATLSRKPHQYWVLGRVVYAICFFFQAEDGIRDLTVTGVQTCALPISGESRCGGDWQGCAGCAARRWQVGRPRRAHGGVENQCERRGQRCEARSCRRGVRSEERRVGKECRSRWAPDHLKKKTDERRADS